MEEKKFKERIIDITEINWIFTSMCFILFALVMAASFAVYKMNQMTTIDNRIYDEEYEEVVCNKTA